MNRQQLIEKVINYYKSGGKPGLLDGCCAYQGSKEEQRCAIGCLVRNPKELEDIGGDIYGLWEWCVKRNVESVLQQIKEIMPDDLVTYEEKLEFLDQVQTAHDSATYGSFDENSEEYAAEMAAFMANLEARLLTLIPNERSTEAVSSS